MTGSGHVCSKSAVIFVFPLSCSMHSETEGVILLSLHASV
jgi:hypothetical protein